MEAAEIADTSASPLTTASQRIGMVGKRLPSTRTSLGTKAQAVNRATHGKQGCLQDIQPINLLDTGLRH
jgi:hypothetical protein